MSEAQLYTIEAANLPSRAHSVTFREPLFKDRREASRRMPPDDTNIGYSLEQLLLATCIEGIDGHSYPPIPRDPISKLRDFSPADTQFLVAVFLEMFTLGDELSETVKSLSEELKSGIGMSYTIPKEYMPSGNFSVTFRGPTTGDQIDTDRRYPGADSNCGYSLEEMLFASSLTHVNGEAVEPQKDPIVVLDPWTHIDAQFALSVFLNVSFIDRNTRAGAKSLGKQLRAKSAPVADAPKKSRATSTTA